MIYNVCNQIRITWNALLKCVILKDFESKAIRPINKDIIDNGWIDRFKNQEMKISYESNYITPC